MTTSESEQRFESAKGLHRAGRHAEALAILDDLILAHPDSARLAYARALCLEALGRVEEAIQTCEHALSRAEHARTRELLARLRATPVPVTPKRPFPWVRTVAWLSAALVTGGVAWWLPGHLERRAIDEAMGGEGAHAALADMEARYEERLADYERYREQFPEDDSPAMAVRPRDEWINLALAGQRLTEPGIYEEVPGLTRDSYVFNYFLPSAYGEQPDARLPWVVISHPGDQTHFLGLIEWAEARGVILIVFNDSGRVYAQNPQVQQAGLYTATELLRIDPERGMAIGVSGGARTNWDMVNRHPGHFVGLVMIAFSGGDTGPLPPDKRVAYIHGDNDFNARAVHRALPRMQRRGHEIIHFEFPGGHELGPLELRTRALDWLLER